MDNTGSTMAQRILEAIRADAAAEDARLAAGLADAHGATAGPGFSDLFRLAVGDDRAGDEDYLFALEYVCEGYLLHYGASRLFAGGDPEFALLAGDYMYARGLDRLTSRGDLAGIGLLSGLISFCSLVHCEGLDATLAADAWAVTTLALAAVAAGADASGVTVDMATGESSARDALSLALVTLISAHPPDRAAVLRDELCNIYNSFNQLRRPDGTG